MSQHIVLQSSHLQLDTLYVIHQKKWHMKTYINTNTLIVKLTVNKPHCCLSQRGAKHPFRSPVSSSVYFLVNLST